MKHKLSNKLSKNKPRLYRGLPVRDGRADLHIQPNINDIRQAKPKDPSNCAYAVCIKRTLDVENVFVFRSIAYIQTLDAKGQPVMERYVIKKAAKELLIRFDKGQAISPGGFVFNKPPKSRTLDYLLKQERDRESRGVISPRTSEGSKTKPRKVRLGNGFHEVRTGTGMVHLIGREDQIRVKE